MGSPEMGSREKPYLWDFQPRPLSVIYPAVKLDASLDAIQLKTARDVLPWLNPTRRLSRIKECIARQTPVLCRKWQSGHSCGPPRN